MKSSIWLAVAFTTLGGVAFAEETRHADAHEHGHGTFQMVIEDDHAVIEIAVPAFDIIGFEHTPSTTAQRNAMADAAAALSRPNTLFAMPAAAGCAIGQIEIGFGATGGHRHEHGDQDEHEEHADDNHGKDDHEKDEETHSEVKAFYLLACEKTEALNRIEFGYFDAFPEAEELDVVILSAAGQSAGEVDRDNKVFEIE